MNSSIPPRINDKLNSPDASDRVILQLFEYFFPRLELEIPVTSSGCFIIQGHGDDLTINSRKKIIDAILENYPSLEPIRPDIERYINNNVKLCIAMGLPGPTSPMGEEIDDGRWPGSTTSEIDLNIVRNIYKLFNNDQTRCIGNPPCLKTVNFIIRRQLRANFMKIWKSYPTGTWGQFFRRLMGMHEIWVQKEFNTETSFDRSYFLRPNVGENPIYRVHEGIHLIDMRDENGDTIPNLVLPSYNVDFDVNNLEFPECRARLDAYFHSLYAGVKKTQMKIYETVFNTIMEKINNRNNPIVLLSDIILLGFLLKIENLQLYDPTCRPLSDETRKAYTKRGTIFRTGDITGALAYQHETLKRQNSFGGKTCKKYKKRRGSYRNKSISKKRVR